jgi:hypothetical protein
MHASFGGAPVLSAVISTQSQAFLLGHLTDIRKTAGCSLDAALAAHSDHDPPSRSHIASGIPFPLKGCRRVGAIPAYVCLRLPAALAACSLHKPASASRVRVCYAVG